MLQIWNRDDFIEHTKEVWQQHSKSQISAEDAREIFGNVAGFFSLLSKWDAERDEYIRHDPDDELGRDGRMEW